MAWLPNYANRKLLTWTGSTAGAQASYQKWVTLHKTTGTDNPATGDIYLGTLIKDDFSDIQFTSSDGVTPLYYWIESSVSGVSAVVAVCVDSIPASPGTATSYLYHNYPAAVSASDGTNTFIAFDDFERGVNGDPVGGAWTPLAGLCNISTVHDIGDVAGYTGTRGFLNGGGGGASGATIPNVVSVNKSINFKFYKEAASEIRIFHADTVKRIYILTVTGDVNLYYYDGTVRDTGKDITADAWQTLEFRNCNFTAGTFDIYLNGVLAKSGAGMLADATGFYNNVVSLENWSTTAGRESWFDNYYVRNWCSPEPALTSVGPDEVRGLFRVRKTPCLRRSKFCSRLRLGP